MISQLQNGLRLGQFSLFNEFPEIIHGVTGRHGGVSAGRYASLNLGCAVGDAAEAVAENRRRVYASLGLDPRRGMSGEQVHGAQVAAIEGNWPLGVLSGAASAAGADALVTGAPGVGLLVISADCVPVLLWDPVRRVVGTVHAGWRGTVAGIAGRAIAAMSGRFGCLPQNVRAGIGPAIGPCCYEVDGPVLEPLRAAFPEDWPELVRMTGEGRGNLDLWEANRRQFVATGLVPDNIEVAGICTRCHHEEFFSERAEGRPLGRFGSVIALRDPGY